MGKSVKRLFDQFRPEHYELSIAPDNDKMTFHGTVTITGRKVGRPSQRLTLHQRGLKVTSANVVRHDKRGSAKLTIDRINPHGRLTEVRLHSSQMLYPGDYTVTLEFSGKITKQMNGLYPCYYDYEGKQKMLLATQFESHYAREAFPCIDEPEAKATFQLTVSHVASEVALSNTPIEKQEEVQSGKKLRTTFEVTPRMSTYLLAFVIGELHCVEANTKDGITVRSWSSIARKKVDLQYSLDEAVRVLECLTEYFGVSYPLAKCDQVALPDFDSGAMENWGLITYREIAMLADPDNRSAASEQYISLVVAHELSHQWFGNLVTMKWWDDLWLNESFASLMEYIVLDAIHPDWNVWEMYASSDVVSTSSRDVYSDIQPVGVAVTDPDIIDTLFDPGIVYAKGGRLLKMLREYIGDEDFVNGLRQYFQKHAFGNASREDLWAALSASSGKDISALMTPWLAKPGMPVLHVSQKEDRLTIQQERFMLDKPADGSLWPVPLLPDKPFQPDIFSEPSIEINLPDHDCRILNHLASGHYFVDYDEPDHREYIAEQFSEQSLQTEARISLLNDLFMLSRRGDASLTEGLDLIKHAQNEPRDGVWGMIMRVISACSQLTESDDDDTNLKAFRRRLGRSWYQKLGWDHSQDDDPNTRQMRHNMIALMIAGEDKDALDKSKAIYQSVKNAQDIDAELRNTILAANVRHKTPKVVEELMRIYPKATAELQLDIIGALASTKDPKIASAILSKALGSNGFVRQQDILRWIALFLRNYYVRDVTWEYLVKNWDWAETTLATSKSFDFLPLYCAGVLNTPAGLVKFDKLFGDKHRIKVLQHNIKVGRADIQARISWRQREEAKIKSWLEAWSKDQLKSS